MATSCTVSMTSGGRKRTLPLSPSPAAAAAPSTRHDAGVTLLAAARGLSWTPVGTRHLMRCNMARRRRAAPPASIRASLPRSPRPARPFARSPTLGAPKLPAERDGAAGAEKRAEAQKDLTNGGASTTPGRPRGGRGGGAKLGIRWRRDGPTGQRASLVRRSGGGGRREGAA